MKFLNESFFYPFFFVNNCLMKEERGVVCFSLEPCQRRGAKSLLMLLILRNINIVATFDSCRLAVTNDT